MSTLNRLVIASRAPNQKIKKTNPTATTILTNRIATATKTYPIKVLVCPVHNQTKSNIHIGWQYEQNTHLLLQPKIECYFWEYKKTNCNKCKAE